MKDKILLIDDDILYCEYIKNIFQSKSEIDVVSEIDAHKGLQRIIDGELFVAILVDIRMPSLNGFQVAELLKPYEHPPIIFLTGLDFEHIDKSQVIKCGVIDIISKSPLEETSANIVNKIISVASYYKRYRDKYNECIYLLSESQRIANIGSYKFDVNNDLWESSKNMDEIFGINYKYKKNTQGWLEIIHPDDRVMMDIYLRDIIVQHKSFDKGYRIVRKSDNVIRLVHGLGNLIYNSENNITLIGTVKDITNETNIKNKYLHNLEIFKNLIETTKTAYLITALNGTIKETNNTFLEIIECKKTEIINQNIFNLLSETDANKLHKNILLMEKGNPIEDLEICLDSKFCHKKGSWIRINANIMENGEKTILYLIKDITTKKIEDFGNYINNQKQKDRVRQNIYQIRNKIQNMRNNKQEGAKK